MKRRTLILRLPFAALPGLSALPAFGHGDKPHAAKKAAPPEQKEWGIAGNPKKVSRTVAIEMLDTMRFVPDTLRVREGETLRLMVRNRGKLMHEIVIGTRAELEAHAALMLKHPTMEHDEPYMAHVAPGRRGELLWHFNRPGAFEFACLIPGHFQAGMVGRIDVLPR